MSCVKPVAMRSDEFCIICSFVMLVVDAIGDHILMDEGNNNNSPVSNAVEWTS